MSKFVVVIFPNETKAYDGVRALKELHADGSLTVYGMAVIAKDGQGKVAVRDAADSGPLGTAAGALVGALVGIIGGPAAALTGLAGGALIGSLWDLFSLGVGTDFIDKVSKELVPGKTAIIAEIAETWVTPLDTRMGALGGVVLRTWRADYEDEQIGREIAAAKVDYEQLNVEFKHARDEAKAKLKVRLDQAKATLADTQRKAATRLEALETEMTAKAAELQKQLSGASAEAKAKLNQSLTALRTDYATRSSKLKQAWTLTKDALAA